LPTTIVIVPLAEGASVLVQLTVPFVPTDGVVQTQPGALIDVNVSPAGSGSSIVASPLLGPDAEYPMVYVSGAPELKVAGALFVTPRFGLPYDIAGNRGGVVVRTG